MKTTIGNFRYKVYLIEFNTGPDGEAVLTFDEPAHLENFDDFLSGVMSERYRLIRALRREAAFWHRRAEEEEKKGEGIEYFREAWSMESLARKIEDADL